ERMLADGMFESAQRMGAEQEMFLVDRSTLGPALVAQQVLDEIEDTRFTTELARFNLEANLDPHPLRGSFLRQLEMDLDALIAKANGVARRHNAAAILAGILPTLERSDLTLDSMSPQPRYRQLNQSLLDLSGRAFSIFIRGVDEFAATHDNVMMEAANTSFQLHMQVAPEDFARLYNFAQLISAPLLAVASNSPVLLGRRLWQETRVALFESSVDSRSTSKIARGHRRRVSFGTDWIKDSVLEILRDDAARFAPVLTCAAEDDPLGCVVRGEAPKLAAVSLHNGTVWRWNRACYGRSGDGRPHLRIENRVLPAGPTVLDEVANAALFYGLMRALPERYPDLTRKLPFRAATENFVAAARYGLGARLSWLNRRSVPADALLRDELLDAAEEGLEDLGVPTQDIARYLGTVRERVRCGQTGSRWFLSSLDNSLAPRQQHIRNVTASMLRNQEREDHPVHLWPLARPWGDRPATASDCMSTDLFTQRSDQVASLAEAIMTWNTFHHIPVEDASNLCGLVSLEDLTRRREAGEDLDQLTLADVLDPDPVTIPPDTPIDEVRERVALKGCVLVTEDGHLIGLVSSRDLPEEP
ncbi:MAG: CBS domain-containing protein, partial [Planctomycetota bacterium]